MTSNNLDIEFMGGPLDGLRQVISVTGGVPAKLGFPISVNVFRMMEGKRLGPPQVPTSVAVYQVVETEGTWRFLRYRFVGAVSPSEVVTKG